METKTRKKKKISLSPNKEMINIAKVYFHALNKQQEFGFSENDCINPYAPFISHVHKAFTSLSSFHQSIINNEFFYQNYPEWWKELYPSSSFYKYKKQAVECFLKEFKK